jgi:hypothetical protein
MKSQEENVTLCFCHVWIHGLKLNDGFTNIVLEKKNKVIEVLSIVYGFVTNNNGFWIA